MVDLQSGLGSLHWVAVFAVNLLFATPPVLALLVGAGLALSWVWLGGCLRAAADRGRRPSPGARLGRMALMIAALLLLGVLLAGGPGSGVIGDPVLVQQQSAVALEFLLYLLAGAVLGALVAAVRPRCTRRLRG